jgi:outer membrane lipoprotein-sorting protein
MRSVPLLLVLLAAPLSAQSGEELLARVDKLRHPWPAFTVELELKDGKASQRWQVTTRENGDARLDGLSAKEKGRSVLMLGDRMWLLVPGSRRPLQVTPQQRMMGPAAGGDVARTRFRQDYTVQALHEETQEGRPCWRLELVAKSAQLSARTAQLWVAKEPLQPLKAEFYMASGKLARTATFGPPVQTLGQTVLSGMELLEPSGAKVSLVFSRWSKGGQDPERFELP